LNMIIENKLYILSKANSDREHFSDYTSQYKKIEQVIGILYILQLWLYIIIVIFSVSIAVIIYSVIGNFIYYFRDEIYITQLVWGSKVFINGPFTLQGAIYSFVAFLLSIISFLFIIQTINKELENLYFLNISYNIFLIEWISFIVIGWLSWLLSSRRYLK
jgi:cell division protein FtsX